MPRPMFYRPARTPQKRRTNNERRKGPDQLKEMSSGTTGTGESTLTPLTVLPGDGYVAERLDENGVRTVLPLAGWIVSPDGELLPLPRSMGADWVIRPATANDPGLISTTASRMQAKPKQRSYL